MPRLKQIVWPHTLFFTVLVVFGFSLTTSCSSNEKNPESTLGLKIYGEFCGPGHPKNTTGSSSSHIKMLASLTPKDSIDFACQQHDLCYTAFGRELMCDEILINQIEAMQFEDEVKGQCDFLGYAIAKYFNQLNPADSRLNRSITAQSYIYKTLSLFGNTELAITVLGLKATNGYPGKDTFCEDLTPPSERIPHGENTKFYIETLVETQCGRRAYYAYARSETDKNGHVKLQIDPADNLDPILKQQVVERNRALNDKIVNSLSVKAWKRIDDQVKLSPQLTSKMHTGYELTRCMIEEEGLSVLPLAEINTKLAMCEYFKEDSMRVICTVYTMMFESN